MLGFHKLYIMFSRKYHQKHREKNVFTPAKRLVTMGFLKSVSCGIIEKEGAGTGIEFVHRQQSTVHS